MRSIGVLRYIRKKKRGLGANGLSVSGGIFRLLFCALAAGMLALSVPAFAQEGDARITTRNNKSGIGKDPATGARTMQTPDPEPQDRHEGPQTVIVAPEITLDRTGPGGQRPPQRPKPR